MGRALRVAVIGRTEILYDSALALRNAGFEIVCILTAKEAPEYSRTAADFKTLAQSWNIPFEQGSKISDHMELLRTSRADVGVSINYTAVIPQSVIDIFPLGILNAHGGDLPRYRGNACQAWAIINGERRVGLCVHKMEGGELDSGAIIARDFFPVDNHTKITDVWHWMAMRTPKLVTDAINLLSIDPNFILEEQSKSIKDALRCYPRTPEDGRIDWNKSALDILRLINASNKPYSGAFCNLDGERFTIWEAELVDDNENFCAVHGQILKIETDFVEVACFKSKLRIILAEYKNHVASPAIWIKSVRKRLV